MKITLEGAIYGEKNYDGTYRYTFFRSVCRGGLRSLFFVCEHAIEFDLDEKFSPYMAQLEVLKANRENVLADNQMKLQDAEEAIQNHLAIGG